MNFTALFIKRPVMTTLVMIAILAFGTMAYRQLAVSDLPNVDYPTITVTASLPGASPETMASSVATPLEKQFTTIAGIGCSSRFPYFVQAHGVHFIHGRALPFASGISLTRPDLHVFVFGGDGDAFSIGGNHFNHTARKNIKLTYCVMDNWVYGLTKKQTSPTSPLGFKSKTDQWGAVDYPINPMKQAIAAGATFVARTTHTNPNHVLQMMEAAMDHDGFSFIECLSECVEFYEGAFDASNPRKGGVFNLVPPTHDVTDEMAAYKLADEPFPGSFGIFYKVTKPTKNAKEAAINKPMMEKVAGLKDWQILQKNFDRVK